MIGDKDGVVNSLTASHEFHMSKYDGQEDVLATGVAKDLEKQIAKMHEQELKRNRNRVLEIIRFVETSLQEIDLAEEV